MSRFLCVDIGAGTMDVLWFDTEALHHYKAVVVSPVRTIAERASQLQGDLVVTGCEMGGGPVTEVLRRRAETNEVILSVSAAATLHHNLEQVRSWGITVVEDTEAEKLRRHSRYAHLVLQDVEADRLERIVEGFGVPFGSMPWRSACRIMACRHRGFHTSISGIEFTGNGWSSGPIHICCFFPATEVPRS